MALGLTIGLIWMLQALTGAMLAFEQELDFLTNRDLFEVQESGAEMSLEEQVQLVREQLPELAKEIYLIGLMDYPGVATLMLAKPAGEAGPKDGVRIFVDPFAGKIKGVQSYKDSLMGKVYHFHRTLYLGKWGKWITSTSGVLLMGSVLGGVLVWWARRRNENSRQERLYRMHLRLGMWFAPIIFIIALNGVLVTYRFAYIPFLYLVTGSEIPAKIFKPIEIEPRPDHERLSLNRILEIAEEAVPVATHGVMLEPTDPERPVTVIRRKPGEPRAAGGTFVDIDPYTGEVLDIFDFTEGTAAARLTYFTIHLHTGEWGGYFGEAGKLATRILWCLSALIVVVLGVVGLITFWRRRRSTDWDR
ncbi:MAG: PepSY-associated TM helix domain-containing protein [Verrucomicrobiota bacterium]